MELTKKEEEEIQTMIMKRKTGRIRKIWKDKENKKKKKNDYIYYYFIINLLKLFH